MPLGDHVKGDEIGKACSTYGGENSTVDFGEEIWRKETTWKTDTQIRKIILKWILNKRSGMAWTGFIWLCTAKSDVLLRTRYWTYGFLKMRGNSWPADRLHQFLKKSASYTRSQSHRTRCLTPVQSTHDVLHLSQYKSTSKYWRSLVPFAAQDGPRLKSQQASPTLPASVAARSNSARCFYFQVQCLPFYFTRSILFLVRKQAVAVLLADVRAIRCLALAALTGHNLPQLQEYGIGYLNFKIIWHMFVIQQSPGRQELFWQVSY